MHAFERALVDNPDVVLVWTQPARYSNALDRVTLVQALVTWARTAQHPTMRFGGETITKRQLIGALRADELVITATLAASVQRADGSDATDAIRQVLRTELATRRAIADDDGHRTLILSTLEHRLAYSPDVMTRSPAGDTTDWTTRTMFHRVDIEGLSPDERSLLVGAGEDIEHGARRGTWLRRTAWPIDHPLAATDPVTTVGQRLLRPTSEMLAEWQRGFPLDTTPADRLGQALWEIFQNTEHHALTSKDQPIPRAIRALIATPMRTNDFADADMSPVAIYARDNPHDTFVAISIIDSGDGLAFTAAARHDILELDPAAELRYFQRAGSGDARSPERPLHGFGMPIVGHLLTEMGGLIQIRSGSIVLYRDFREAPFTARKRDLTTDWSFDLDDATDQHRRWGSVVTIVLPRHGGTQ